MGGECEGSLIHLETTTNYASVKKFEGLTVIFVSNDMVGLVCSTFALVLKVSSRVTSWFARAENVTRSWQHPPPPPCRSE